MDFDLTKKECESVGGVHDGLVCLTKDTKFEGKHQSMNWGTLISNPSFLLKMKGTDRLYGDFSVSNSNFDRVVSMEKDLSLSEQTKYLKKHDPRVYVYHINKKGKNGIVKKKIFRTIEKITWKELGEI